MTTKKQINKTLSTTGVHYLNRRSNRTDSNWSVETGQSHDKSRSSLHPRKRLSTVVDQLIRLLGGNLT